MPPIPLKQLLEPDDRRVGDTSENVGKARLRIDVIEHGPHSQRRQERRREWAGQNLHHLIDICSLAGRLDHRSGWAPMIDGSSTIVCCLC